MGPFLKRLLVVLLVVALAWLAWQLRFVLLLAFGSVLLAIIIRTAANGICRRTPLPETLVYPLVTILLLGIPVFALWKFGSDISQQANLISEAIPDAIDRVETLLAGTGITGLDAESLREELSASQAYTTISGMVMTGADALTNIALVLAGGIYLAANPSLYRAGLLKLLPRRSRDNADLAMSEAGTALGLWLKGRLLAMILVGVLTGLGLWAIGVPSYLALGLLAGLLEFIPFIGPIIAAIPAILLALLGDPVDALWVAGLFLLIQQLEGNAITPLIQQHAVDLPPALLIFAVLGFGTLFGIVGILLAAPLTVVLFIFVKRLYVREYLDTPTPIPGVDEDEDAESQ